MAKYINLSRVKGVVGSINFHSDNVCSISVATNVYTKNKTSNQVDTQTTWHKIVLFQKLAEQAKVLNITKGNVILVEGPTRTNVWKDKNDQEQKTNEIVANSLDVVVVPPKQDKAVANQVPSQAQVIPQNVGQPVQGPQVNSSNGYVDY